MSEHKLYNGEIILKFNESKHLYTVNDEVVDGVTSALGIVAKPALVYWSANKAGEYIEKFLPVGKPIDEIEKKQLVEGCKKAHRTLKDNAADLGTMLHALIEDFAKGKTVPEPVNPILNKSFNQFKDWVKANNVRFIDSERKIYSKRFNYAGTLDLLADNGTKMLIDIKTSSGIWDEYYLQVAAYIQAINEEMDLGLRKGVIIRCGKDGVFEVKETDEFEENLQGFLGALRLYRRLKQLKYKEGVCK